jgi:tRNA-dihydrouridine synthase B
LEKTAKLVSMVVNAVKVPVTAKMRLGWDEQNLTAPNLARSLEDVGLAAVFIHGRTREQGFSGTVNLPGIRAVVEAVRQIPVIGNGDVTTPQIARQMFAETGCQGVSIGRGAFHNPWIFAQTRHFLDTGDLLPDPSFQDRIAIMRRHIDLSIQIFGETLACRMFRKVGPWYANRFGPSKLFNKKIVTLSSKAHFEEILQEYIHWREQFLNEQGELKTQYRPQPLPEAIKTGQPSGDTSGISVPKGPVSLW